MLRNILDKVWKKSTSSSYEEHLAPMEIPYRLQMLVIADTHMCLPESALRELANEKIFDVCILLGDISAMEIEMIKRVVADKAPILGVLGNHDSERLHQYYNIQNLHGCVVSVKGVKIAGIDGSVRYKDVDAPMYTDQESIEIARSMPAADLLISHDSPKHLYGESTAAHSGLQGVGTYCMEHNVPLNLHGHHHRNEMTILQNGTTCVGCHGLRYIDTATLLTDAANNKRKKAEEHTP